MRSFALLLIIGLAALTIAHGDNHDEEPAAASVDLSANGDPESTGLSSSYFAYSNDKAFIYTHIVLMTLSWVFGLPTAVMLSLARSRYTLLAQSVFLVGNIVGVAVGIIYNGKTPDLYPNNAHHKLGWIATIIVSGQVFLRLLDRVTGFMKRDAASKQAYHQLRSFITSRMSSAGDRRRTSDVLSPHRASYDSGHGTEGLTESLRSNSVSTVAEGRPLRFEEGEQGFEEEDLFTDDEYLARGSRPIRLYGWISKIPMDVFRRGSKAIGLWYDIVDRVILPFGFATFCTGIATFARFFEGHEIFGGLAHWIKGGVFFWIGIFTLGRWSGSFGDLGWAWNIRPRKNNRKWQPSAEFVESALIFIYGSTNIFLEHLGETDGAWSAQDLEHISITVLFIGGGLCGMLIESTKIRDLLNTAAAKASEPSETDQEAARVHIEKEQSLEDPDTYGVSLNPIPALVIILLGIMMSSHHQHSMVSTMVHKQWGNLLVAGGFARGFTYVIMYLKPPRSVLPSRPPTELLASFGLISGGIIFMASSSDTVAGMEYYDLDAMFMYTVTMGLVGMLMAWILFVLALKGWAVRSEATQIARLQRVA